MRPFDPELRDLSPSEPLTPTSWPPFAPFTGARSISTLAPPQEADPLSPREKEVLQLLAQGYTNQETAERLFLSVKTVETYKARLMEKLGLRSRVELLRYALEHGLLSPH